MVTWCLPASAAAGPPSNRLPHAPSPCPTPPPPLQPLNATDCGLELEYSDDGSHADAQEEHCGRAAALATNGGAAIADADGGEAVAAADGPAAAVSSTKPRQAVAVAVAGAGGSAKSAAGI